MPNEGYVIISALGSALIAFMAARVTSAVQLKIARDISKKDIELQQCRLLDERQRIEAALEREKLELLHKMLSRLSFENSQTMSYIQNAGKDLASYRGRYLENCSRLHEALAISDLYYPNMSAAIRKIYGQSNIFWGHQEALLQIDIKENSVGWQSNLGEVLSAGATIGRLVDELHEQIRRRGRAINQGLAVSP